MLKVTKIKNNVLATINGGGRQLYQGANGYLTRGRNGRYRYVVTKTPSEAVFRVMAKGWGNALGGGWASRKN
ncbi:garvicin Q family class II bacteriocin [Enterococcus sp. DIV0800]|uniref:garvicin Q family class II bacteriocin n=1 Tax=unclassified Enterococcus TaxID=2608891 RepID=UPI003D2FD458